jgi:O-antigen ligase
MKALAVSLGFFIPISTFMTNIVLGLLLILWSRWSNIKKLPQLWQHFTALKAVSLFLVVVGIACVYSVGSTQDILYSFKKSSKLLAIFILLPLFVEKKWRMRAYWAFLGAVGLTVFFALLDHLALYQIPKKLFHVEPQRPDVFKDTLYTALLVAMGTFVAAQLADAYRTRPKHVMFLTVFVALSTYVMLWVNTGRSGQLIFCSLWCLFCLRVWRFKGLASGTAALFLILTMAWMAPTSRLSERWIEVVNALRPKIEQITVAQDNNTPSPIKVEVSREAETGSTAIRLNVWREGWRMIKERPWFGWGTGSFQLLATKAANNQAGVIHVSVAKNPHNQYLNIGIQQGFFGLCALLFLFVSLLKTSWGLPRLESGLLQGTLVAMAIGCLGNSWLTDFTTGYLFIWLISITIPAAYQNKIKGEAHVSCI